jgi:hypothetical protein
VNQTKIQMISLSSTFLQARPNAGIMQLIILLFIVGIIWLARSLRKKSKNNELSSTNENTSQLSTGSTLNIDAGVELIRAGKNLVTAIVILICTILGNYVYFEIYNDKIQRDFNAAKDYFENLKVLAYIDLGMFIIILGLMYLGFYSLRVAGEKLAGRRN